MRPSLIVQVWLPFFGCVALVAQACEPAPMFEMSSAWVNRDDAHTQAKLSACLGSDISSSIAFFQPPLLGGYAGEDDVRLCLKAATTCAAVRECTGYSLTECEQGSFRCEGSVALTCSSTKQPMALESRRDCAVDPAGNHQCAVGKDSKGETLAFCHAAAPCNESRCDQDVAAYCVGGWEQRLDCRASGRVCVQNDNVVRCVFPAECVRDECSGDILRVCSDGRVLLEGACSVVIPGTTCVQNDSTASCEPVVTAPDCLAHPTNDQWCEGNVSVTCMYGVRFEIDCSVLQGGHCKYRPWGGLADGNRSGCTAAGSVDINALL